MTQERGGPVHDIAIVGMACLFPGAPDLATFAANLAAGTDAIRDVPAGRWDPIFYDPASHASDRFYCRRGGFVDENAWFDAIAHGVMPVAAAAAEPDQLLALEVAARAFADAGLADRDFDRRRAGVILGRGSYPGAGRARLDQHVRGTEQLLRALRRLVPGVSEAQLADVKKEYQAQLAAAGPDAAIGLVPNLAASRIAHRLDLAGPAWTVDAACASALIAVDQATQALRNRRLDVVLCGGVHFCQDEAFWSVFCQLGALSRNEAIRPFDARADGLLIGEGAGIVALMRREDAEAAGLRVYALIRGVGTSSDGRGATLMSPAVAGQVAALTDAWRDAGLDPTTVGLVEAHGTATPTGDAAELETLRQVFGDGEAFLGAGERAVLGSVKSMIGHTMPAAGAAGLIKAALALHQRTLFPSLHCEEPHPALARTRFHVLAKAEEWGWSAASARRAAVSAFGFGGINAHVVLEEAEGGGETRVQVAVGPRAESAQRAIFLSAADPAGLLAALDSPPTGAVGRAGEGACRLAVLDPTPERLAKARQVVEKGRPWRGRDGIFFGGARVEPGGLLAHGGKLAFLFPGVDLAQKSRLSDVAAHFGRKLPPEALGQSIEHQGLALVEAGRLLSQALAEMGVHPALGIGHSVGEWTAMVVSGMLPEKEVAPFVERARSEVLEVPGVAFAALGAGVERVQGLLEGLADIAVSHDNCPHQVILCGADAAIDEALVRARTAGVLGQKLPFRSGFHSPLFAPYIGPHRASFAGLTVRKPSFPLWSATTCAPYPDDPAAVRELAVRHLVEPVHFRELVKRVHAEGARVFVQVGPGSAVGFVEDTLRGEPHAAIAANAPDRGGLEQLWRVAALLFSEGLDVKAERLLPPEERSKARARGAVRLALGVPMVDFARPLVMPGALATTAANTNAAAAPADVPVPPGPLATAFTGLLDDLRRATGDVLTKLAETPGQPRRVTRRFSVETHPWLLDHTFFRQPPGWTVASDRHPVVPMTTTIQLMIGEAAALVAPGRVCVSVEEVRAFRWIAVGSPTDLVFELTPRGPDRVRVSVVGFAEATIVFAPAYGAPPEAPPWAVTPGPGRVSAVDAETLYRDRWMFHGPLYQGVSRIGLLRDDGLDGDIVTGAAPGALLDNAGQIYGFWVMQVATQDRLAMPVAIEKLRFFGPHPAPGVKLRCDVRIRVFEARRVVADLVLRENGRVWCEITNWEDRRFDSDDRLWGSLIWPEKSSLAEPFAEAPAARPTSGVLLFRDTYRAAPTREQIYRRYLCEAERAEHDAQLPRGQRGWLAGRIAAKDATRALLGRLGHGPLFPIEVRVATGENGRPLVTGPGKHDLRVSIAHKGELAVALAADGIDVGVDLEAVAPRPPGFAATAFTPEELAMARPGEDLDEWMARLWTAKEATGKRAGTGLDGDPKKWPVTDRTGERLLCRGVQVETRRYEGYVVAWTTG